MEIDATVSSQFISALLMAAPAMTRGLRLTLVGAPASEPYLKMTLGMMRLWGAGPPEAIIHHRDSKSRPTGAPPPTGMRSRL